MKIQFDPSQERQQKNIRLMIGVLKRIFIISESYCKYLKKGYI